VKLWPNDDQRSCCSPEAVARARDTAHAMGAPHFSVNDEARFATDVVAPFVASYLAGETPNPCVECNPGRLARLVELADRFGAAWVATGHYARVVRVAGEPRIARGRDRAKDQSYMLWRVPRRRWNACCCRSASSPSPRCASAPGARRCRRPTSPTVRRSASPRDHREFLAARGAPAQAGEIVDREGRVLGHHAAAGGSRSASGAAWRSAPRSRCTCWRSRPRVVAWWSGRARRSRARSSSFATWSIAASRGRRRRSRGATALSGRRGRRGASGAAVGRSRPGRAANVVPGVAPGSRPSSTATTSSWEEASSLRARRGVHRAPTGVIR